MLGVGGVVVGQPWGSRHPFPIMGPGRGAGIKVALGSLVSARPFEVVL